MGNTTKLDLENKLDCCGLLNTTESREIFKKDVDSCGAVSIKAFNMGHLVCPCVKIESFLILTLCTDYIVHCMLGQSTLCNTNLSCEAL